MKRKHDTPRRKSIATRATEASEATRLQAYKKASAEVEAEVRKLGLWHACEVNDNRLKSLKQQILNKGAHDLTVLVNSGVPQDMLLELLGSAALTPADCVDAILNEMRNRQTLLKSLAMRMKTLAREATTLLEQPSSGADWWFCFHGGGLAIERHPPRPPRDIADISQALSQMKALSEILNNEQQRFGRYLRGAGRVDPGIVELLVNCWICCSLQRKQAGEKNPIRFQLDCFDELARLLTDAFECAGKQYQFSAAGLRQVFRRHAVPLLKLFFEERPQSTS